MREKLIELLCKAHGMATDASLFEDASYAEQLETEADHLIANGVTIPVRCKDCKRFVDNKEAFVKYCNYACGMKTVSENDFCSYGERRTDA